MATRKSIFILSLLAAASFNAAACYTVYDRAGRIAYQGAESPVDLSQPLHRALDERFPGGHMVFEQAARCEPIAMAQARATQVAAAMPASIPNTAVMGAGPANGKVARSTARAAAAGAGNSPMLTDRQTAMSMNVPYRVLSGDIVVVPAQAAAQIDMSTVTVVPSGVLAAARSETVITELHNPPMTVVQRGQDMVVANR